LHFAQSLPFGRTLSDYTSKNLFGIYVHVPFCVKRCPYCAFASTVVHPIPEDEFVEALLYELDAKAKDFSHRRLHTIYFGGGTPSLLKTSTLKILLSAFSARFGLADEITIEVNPEHVNEESAKAWKDLGFNRVSLGIQSFDAKTLAALGRRHSPEDAHFAIKTLAAARFDDISIDLIYGCASATRESFLADLEQAEISAAKQLSIYELSIEDYTAFGTRAKRGEMIKSGENEIFEQLEIIEENVFPFQRYEISSFSRDAYYSAHNISCWAGVPYLGLGPGAHSFNHTKDGKFYRWANKVHLRQYFQNPTNSLDFFEELKAETHLAERLILGLRTVFPLDLDAIINDTAPPYPELPTALHRCENRGWITRRDSEIRVTTLGLRFHDAMSVEILPSF
jgi:oxygen-independent coproporphyrinogen-3 oxidase